MAETAPLDRLGPLAGQRAAVMPLPPLTRFSLRGGPAAAAGIGAVFGLSPSPEACCAVEAGERAALWLGPDEWLLVAGAGDGPVLQPALEAALGAVPHSLVDISHRNGGFTIAGNGAVQLLAEGCPLDLEACPVGFCSRTVLGKAEVMLWRRAVDRFHVECWRSFTPYLSAFLDQAALNQG